MIHHLFVPVLDSILFPLFARVERIVIVNIEEYKHGGLFLQVGVIHGKYIVALLGEVRNLDFNRLLVEQVMILLVTNTQILCLFLGNPKQGAEEFSLADVVIAYKNVSEEIVILRVLRRLFPFFAFFNLKKFYSSSHFLLFLST